LFKCSTVLACNQALDRWMYPWSARASRRPKLVPRISNVRPIRPMPFVKVWSVVSFIPNVSVIICPWTAAMKAA
jgi:hypothetical protein